MAITGVSSISGQQIIAAGALSAASAGTALFDENGNPITSYLTAIPTGYATSGDVTGTAQYGLTTAGWSEITGGGGGVSGTNVVFKPWYEGATDGDYYSANISGDVSVTTGQYGYDYINPRTTYSLSSIGNNLGNKLDKNKIEDSNTIAIIDDHAEVTGKACRPTGFTDVSAYNVDVRLDNLNVDFMSNNAGLYSAIVIVETDASAQDIPDNWSLVSYENNSAIFTRSYRYGETYDIFILGSFNGWGDFTNAEASATVYSATELAPLAFKDEIPSTANFLTTADSANFYTTANESGFITGVPAGTMNESAFGYDASNNITGYNGSAFKAGDEFPQSATEVIETVTANSADWNGTTETVSANSANWGGSILNLSSRDGIDLELSDNTLYIGASAITASITGKQDKLTFDYNANDAISAINGSAIGGSDVPEGVMVESGLEYNAVNEISGYNGSAIAQYGAEKQWLVHDDTLCHLSNSAQYALGVNLSAVAQLLGIDETVLWTGARQTTGTIQLSESMWNYNEMDIYICPDYNTYSTRMGYQITRLAVIPQTDANEQLLCYAKSNRIASNTYLSELFYLRFNPDGNSVDFSPGIKWSNNTVTTGVTAFTGAVTKIVGIGRKS